jgi:Ca-activated chloride channel family protein
VGAPDIDQTNAEIGEVAPVRPIAVRKGAPPATGRRVALRDSPSGPAVPRASLELAEVRAPRAAAAAHAGQLKAPAVEPSPTAIELAAPEPQAIIIPLDESIARKEFDRPPVLIFPTEFPDEEPPTPVTPLSDEVAVNVDMFARPGEPLHYFRIAISVAKRDKLPVIPKDVIFICDVSLSIRRGELKITQQAVAEYLGQLRPTDRFNVVVFSEEARKLFPDFVRPTPERIAAASRFIERIPGQIKTDVYRVLRAVVRDIAQQSVRNRPTSILFISDGRATSGIREARRIVNEIGAFSRPNFAILPFDAGRGGNRYLLDLLAYRSRGQAAFVDSFDDAAKRLAALFRSYDSPMLMQLRLLYTNLDVEETYPAFLPNLYAEQPIVIYGRCKPGQDVTIQLQGKNPYARRTLTYNHAPGAPDPTRSDIAREWARQKIHHIVSDMVRVGETPALKAEIERLGRDYNVRTPYD